MKTASAEPAPPLDLEEERLEVEDAARWEAAVPLLHKLGRRVYATTVRSLAPHVGVLRQHAPRPLRVPAAYHDARLPHPLPAVAIVTPTLDSARYLQRTVRSVLTQGYPALRYHVQDGGSSDATHAVLRALAEPASWASEPDRGQADAVNRGFDRVRGEIMSWLNADDVLLPGALAAVTRFFVDHPGVDVVYGHRVLIDEDDREIGRWVMPPHDGGSLSWGDYVPQETLFWRRQIWDRAGGRLDESFEFAMDWDLLLRFRDAGAVFAVMPRFLGAFRVHAAQKTQRLMAGPGWREIVRIRRRLHGRYVPRGEAARALAGYLDRSSLAHALYRVGWRRL
jgi:glycosyltransferase involved in cell wall biosynthesis